MVGKNVILANRLFYNLMRTGHLTENDDKELMLEYMGNSEFRDVVNDISKEYKADIELINNTLYLIPHNDNDVFGFDPSTEIFMSTRENTYLAYAIMVVIIAEFTNSIAPSSYLNVTDIVELTTEYLERASKKEDIRELEIENEYNIASSYKAWKSKIKWDENSKLGKFTIKTEYQIGFVRRVIGFLKKNDLITEIVDEDKIMVTKRFREVVKVYFLNKSRKEIIESMFK